MAISRNNIVTKGLSGMLGDTVVFRQLRNKTIVANRPRKPQRQSEHQRENRQRFRAAALLAKTAMLDPEKKAHYRYKAQKLNLPNAYTAALTDYLRKPTVDQVKYKGHAGDRMTITASKKGFAVASVEVAVMDAQGIRTAMHTATLQDRIRNEWLVCLPTRLRPLLSPGAAHERTCKVIVVAKDHAGNIVTSDAGYRMVA